MNGGESKSKYWCFTTNNPDAEEGYRIQSLVFDGHLVYAVFGNEVGANGTPHYQGYIEYKNRVLRRQVANRFPESHLEPRRGTAREAIDYCKKDGDWVDAGTPTLGGQGKRSDLDAIRTLIVQGSSELELAESYFSKWVVYRRSFEAYRQLLGGSRDWVTAVYIFIGGTGTGKSRIARCVPGSRWVSWDRDCKWYDGYTGQETVVFDDFTGAGIDIGRFLELLDRYECTVPVKGGSANWRPRRVIFTSNLQPDEWFPEASPEQYDAFKRRISRSWKISQPIIFEDGKPCGGSPNFRETLGIE